MSYTQYLQGKAIQSGCEWRLKIKIASEALAIFPTTATFVAQVRETLDGPVLAELTTAATTIVRVDNNTLEFVLLPSVTAEWGEGIVIMDVIRTDQTQPTHLGFDLEIPVKRSITRL